MALKDNLFPVFNLGPALQYSEEFETRRYSQEDADNVRWATYIILQLVQTLNSYEKPCNSKVSEEVADVLFCFERLCYGPLDGIKIREILGLKTGRSDGFVLSNLKAILD